MGNADNIMVSVIIPVYNSEDYLRQCLDSVVGQTLKEIEIICVDDGSTDRSPQILEEYAAKDSRFTILHQKNQYAGAARNYGMEHARGKYMIFWDSDDFFDLNMLEILVHQAERDKAQICACGGRIYDNDLEGVYPTGRFLSYKRVPKKLPYNKNDTGRDFFNICSVVPWNKLFLRSFIEKEGIRFQNIRQANDVYFTMMAQFKADRITAVKKCLVNYRFFNSSSISGQAGEAGWSVPQAYEAVFNEISKSPEFTEDVRQSFALKTIEPLMDAIRRRPTADDAEKLYNYCKSELFPKYDLYGHDLDYFYWELDYERFRAIPEIDFKEFEHRELQNFYIRKSRENGINGIGMKELRSIKSSKGYKIMNRFWQFHKKIKGEI